MRNISQGAPMRRTCSSRSRPMVDESEIRDSNRAVALCDRRSDLSDTNCGAMRRDGQCSDRINSKQQIISVAR